MSNPGNDNRLEELSREAASGYTPPGNASWEKMEAALDIVLPVEGKKKRRIIFWWLFPLAIMGGVLLYSIWPSPAINTTISPVATTSTTPPASSGIYNIPPDKTAVAVQKKNDLVAEKNNSGIPNIQSKRANIIASTKKAATGLPPTNIGATQQQVSTAPVNNQPQNASQLHAQKSATNTAVAQQDAIAVTQVNPSNIVSVIQSSVDSGSNKTMNSIIIPADTTINQQLVLTDSLPGNDSISKKQKNNRSKLSVEFIAGMDASTVKYKYSDKAGINLGILAGYHFNEHWSVHSGALFTRKNYTVAGEDFHAPKNSWVANYKLTLVDGFCDMWEVPLFVRYQFSSNNKRSFFLGAGISSYFMTRENYNYSYYFNGQPVTRNSNYPNGNTHLFSILRLSGGWRKSIGKGSSVLVEPYASLPLGGVGFGNIRLSSYGLNFSFQIRQPSKKK